MSTEEESFNAIFFTKEQFNVRLHFPLPPIFKQFLHFTKIPPTFLHPNAVKILIGCSILNMLYHLDLSLIEVMFIYMIKMSQKEVFSLSAHIPSLQLVIRLLDSTKGSTKRHIVISGHWAGSYENLNHAFEPCHSLGIPGRENCYSLIFTFFIIGSSLTCLTWCFTRKMRTGLLVEWVDKTSFDPLNKPFVIFVGEQDHETLLTNQNLIVLVREMESYVVPTLPCFAPIVLVPKEHFVLKDFPFYEEAWAVDTKTR